MSASILWVVSLLAAAICLAMPKLRRFESIDVYQITWCLAALGFVLIGYLSGR